MNLVITQFDLVVNSRTSNDLWDFQALVLFSSTFKALNLKDFQGCVGTLLFTLPYSLYWVWICITVKHRMSATYWIYITGQKQWTIILFYRLYSTDTQNIGFLLVLINSDKMWDISIRSNDKYNKNDETAKLRMYRISNSGWPDIQTKYSTIL